LKEKHHYSIIDSARVKDSNGKEHEICKIRNPWGDYEWSGNWSDESSLWTEELREKYKVEKSNDGCFWMSWLDILKYFSSFIIAEVRDDCESSSVKMTTDKPVY
jgi:hypothetical protein